MDVILESMKAISPSAMGPSNFLAVAPFLVSLASPDPFSSSPDDWSGFALLFFAGPVRDQKYIMSGLVEFRRFRRVLLLLLELLLPDDDLESANSVPFLLLAFCKKGKSINPLIHCIDEPVLQVLR